MSVDYERKIDSAKDLVEMGKFAWFPSNTHDLQLMNASLQPEERHLANKAVKKRLFAQLFTNFGLSPRKLEKEVLKTG